MKSSYVLNEDYFLKEDEKRVILYSKSELKNDSSKEWSSFIHPLQAKILNIFNQPITIQNAISEVSHIIPNISEETIKRTLSPFINNKTPFYVEWKGNKIKFPKNIIIMSDTKKEYKRRALNISELNNINKFDFKTKRLYRSPIDIVFMLTNRCFTHCSYCYADTYYKSKDITKEVFVDFINQAKSLNVRYIDLIGGDIFYKREWDFFLKTLINYNFSPRFILTKKPLTDEDILKLKKMNYDNELQISLDTLNDNNLKRLLGVNVNYKTSLINSLKKLDENNFKIRINSVVTTLNNNLTDLVDICELLNQLRNVVEWEIRIFMPSMYIGRRNNELLSLNEERKKTINKFISNELELQSKHKIVFFDNTNHTPNDYLSNNAELDWCCSANNSSFFVLPDGKVTICEQLYWHPQFLIGDINKETINEIWNSKKATYLRDIYEKLDNFNSPCTLCNKNYNCFTKYKRCWVNVLKYNGNDFWLHPDPNCLMYNAKK